MLDINLIHHRGRFSIRVFFQGATRGVTALFGPSGAGKTSIVNMVAGLLRPHSGRVTINGTCLFDSANGIDLPPEKRRIGYVFQDGRLFPHLTVRSNLTYGMRRVPPAQRFVHLEEVVALLGIKRLLNRRPASLSGGEKQRVAIGRALLSSPALLLMDEPLASLDTPRKAEVLPFIHRLSRRFDVPILYVSHDPQEVFSLAAQLVVMDDGRVVAAGPAAELTAREDLQSYLRPLDGSFTVSRM